MAIKEIPEELQRLYEIHEWRHASAVLMKDFPDEWSEICSVLSEFRLYKSRVVIPGGSKSLIAAEIDGPLNVLGWRERQFRTTIHVDEQVQESPTHKVDCFKNRVGLEIEWNNKDPFFDRDLNNFRLLFELRALSIGVIITRCDELQAIFNRLGRGTSYGNSTTHMGKLLPRLNGGSGGGCPILVFGIRHALYIEDVPDAEVSDLTAQYKEGRKIRWASVGPLVSKYIPANLLKLAPSKDDEE